MRMPLLSYIVVMGFVLTALLIIVSSQMEPRGPIIATSQIEGLPEPFTPEREPSPYRVTGTNFAAPREAPTDALARADDESATAKPARIAPERQLDYDDRARATWSRPADLPISAMMAIH
jgi:hypothetical protein